MTKVTPSSFNDARVVDFSSVSAPPVTIPTPSAPEWITTYGDPLTYDGNNSLLVMPSSGRSSTQSNKLTLSSPILPLFEPGIDVSIYLVVYHGLQDIGGANTSTIQFEISNDGTNWYQESITSANLALPTDGTITRHVLRWEADSSIVPSKVDQNLQIRISANLTPLHNWQYYYLEKLRVVGCLNAPFNYQTLVEMG